MWSEVFDCKIVCTIYAVSDKQAKTLHYSHYPKILSDFTAGDFFLCFFTFLKIFYNGHVLILELKRIYKIYVKIAAYSENDYRSAIFHYKSGSTGICRTADIWHRSAVAVNEKRATTRHVGDHRLLRRNAEGLLLQSSRSLSFGWKRISKHLTEFCNMELSLISFIYWTITVISVCFFSEAALLISLINAENQQRPRAPGVDFRFRETWLQASLLPLVCSVIWNLFSYFLESQCPHFETGAWDPADMVVVRWHTCRL